MCFTADPAGDGFSLMTIKKPNAWLSERVLLAAKFTIMHSHSCIMVKSVKTIFIRGSYIKAHEKEFGRSLRYRRGKYKIHGLMRLQRPYPPTLAESK